MHRLLLVAALLLMSLGAATPAKAATPEEVKQAINLITSPIKPWTSRALEWDDKQAEFGDGLEVQFVQNGRRYVAAYSGTYRFRTEVEVTVNGERLLHRQRRAEISPQGLGFVVRPDGIKEEGRLFVLVTVGLTGKVTNAWEETGPQHIPVGDGIRAFNEENPPPCLLREEMCVPKGEKFQKEWQGELDTAMKDFLAFLKNE